MTQYDLVIVGGGPGGYVAAIRAAQLGASVALVEKEALGGTCLQWGCIPTKALVRTAELLLETREAAGFGVTIGDVRLDFGRAMKRKSQVVAQGTANLENLLEGAGVRVVQGEARVESPQLIRVFGPKGEQEQLAGTNLLVATGSVPARPPIEGLDSPGVFDSRDVLALERLPGRMVIIGGGVIGLEFASILAAFGCDVTVVEMLPRVLPLGDAEMSRRLTPILRRRGIVCHTKARVKSITPGNGRDLLVAVETGKEDLRLETDAVLVAAGRRPNTSSPAVEELGLAMDGPAIRVDERMATSRPGIWAVGDACGGAMLAHVASTQGIVAVENMFGEPRVVDYRAVPSCVFTIPEVASVGLSEEAAKEQQVPVSVAKFPYSALGKAQATGKTDGVVKLVYRSDDRVVVGMHVLGDGASQLIHEGALAVQNRLTLDQVGHTIHAHPTLSEGVMEAAHVGLGMPIHIMRR